MITQLINQKFDTYCVDKGMAPVWFKKFRTNQFYVYMVLTLILFGCFYTNIDRI
jgi:hypothetical protein